MYNHQEIEKEILKFWEKNKVFDKLREKNKDKKRFSFIDGPITANNPMGVHHAWGRTYKDIFQRFKAMQGFDQRYQNGFDCQGLWVEVEVEKDLGLNSKREIEKFGLANFSKKCKERVEKYSKIQTNQSILLGQWMDWENSYYTMSDNNIQHIWFFLKKCHEKGWLYEGTRVMPWCYRCGTSLSQHELADSYKELTHKAVFLKFPIKNKEKEFLLVWTTTPWTLTSNVAVAVNPEIDYVQVSKNNEFYYLAEKTLSKLGGNYVVIENLKGNNLVGLEYEGPFDYLPVQKDIKHKVISWNLVGEEEGTGLVHIAPGCGAEDNELGKKENLKEIAPLDESGYYIDGFNWLTGKHVSKVLKSILDDLEKRRFLYKIEDYKHRYPCCWRCNEELVFRLVSEWFISADKIRPLMKKESKKVNWHPKFAGKLMQDWLNNMGDWCISRKRYWGLPLPMWKCECSHIEIIGSISELKKKAIFGVSKLKELHRPWIDDVKIKCSECDKEAIRIKDVGDCWLDAGIVPFSTLNYLNDKEYWKKWFPAELVIEMREQIRLWFYSLLFMSVTLENKSPYKNVLVYEKVNDEKGNPMHKSLGNAIWFDDAVEKMGADVMRWIYSSHNPQINLNFGYTPAKEVERYIKVIWNLGIYVKDYCNKKGSEKNLDVASKWIISKRESVKRNVTNYLENLEPHKAMDELKEFLLNDLSRWYGQLIRNNLDNKNVQSVLYNSFLEGLKLLAPFLPFVTEKIYLDLYKGKSIHLEDWPISNIKLIDKKLEENMVFIQDIIQRILAQREKAQLGVRWPLNKVEISSEKNLKEFSEIIKKQTNVKEVVFKKGKLNIKLDTKLTKELEEEGYVREIMRRIQALRKKLKLERKDKIDIAIVSDFDLSKFEKEIKEKVGAKNLFFEEKKFKEKNVEKIKDKTFTIFLNR